MPTWKEAWTYLGSALISSTLGTLVAMQIKSAKLGLQKRSSARQRNNVRPMRPKRHKHRLRWRIRPHLPASALSKCKTPQQRPIRSARRPSKQLLKLRGRQRRLKQQADAAAKEVQEAKEKADAIYINKQRRQASDTTSTNTTVDTVSDFNKTVQTAPESKNTSFVETDAATTATATTTTTTTTTTKTKTTTTTTTT